LVTYFPAVINQVWSAMTLASVSTVMIWFLD